MVPYSIVLDGNTIACQPVQNKGIAYWQQLQVGSKGPFIAILQTLESHHDVGALQQGRYKEKSPTRDGIDLSSLIRIYPI